MSSDQKTEDDVAKPAKLRVSLNQIDHTIAPPGPLDNCNLPAVPVLRIYGNSSSGQKTCLHVHQVYPYFFVDYAGSLKPKDGMSFYIIHLLFSNVILRIVKRYIATLIQSLNHAVAISLKRNPVSPKSRYIRGVVLVKGVHFYGFHSSYSPFLKILVADPSFVNRIVTVLRSGSVMGTRFRIYESHLSFPLQFMCDFGLYGCGLIEVEDGWQRCKDEEESSLGLKPSPHFRQSRLPLEIDVIAPQILNRLRLSPRNVAFKIGEPPPVFPNEPLVLSVRELWDDERSRRKAKGLNPSPELPVDPSDASRGKGADWVAEARYWEHIRNRIQGEGDLDTILTQTQPWEGRVMTTFESVEALWEAPYRRWKPTPHVGVPTNDNIEEDTTHRGEVVDEVNSGPSDIDVDISLISNEDEEDEVDEDVTDILGKAGIRDQDPFVEEDVLVNEDVEGEDTDARDETPVPANEDMSVSQSSLSFITFADIPGFAAMTVTHLPMTRLLKVVNGHTHLRGTGIHS